MLMPPMAMDKVNKAENTLKSPPPETRTMKGASLYGIAITALFNLSLGCIGYAAFGNSSPGNFLTAFKSYGPFWLVDIGNPCIVILLVGAYQNLNLADVVLVNVQATGSYRFSSNEDCANPTNKEDHDKSSEKATNLAGSDAINQGIQVIKGNQKDRYKSSKMESTLVTTEEIAEDHKSTNLGKHYGNDVSSRAKESSNAPLSKEKERFIETRKSRNDCENSVINPSYDNV
ncbi:hypothetical protein EJ110_NYTH29123 [Nymphaea thermarum]|nr:hypothetical protein EJ110_NYTH29123 [Nymphaea thermarum]